jgi:uncharacterized protein
MSINILSLSDVEVSFIYSPQVCEKFSHVNLVFGCGDLPHYYLDYVASSLNAPLYYILGNHDRMDGENNVEPHCKLYGGVNVHRRIVHDHGLLIGGVEGCLLYNNGAHQYTQSQMWIHVFSMLPYLFMNRIIYGRYLDIFLSHAPPWGIHDQKDKSHQGIKAFTWLLKTFKPYYHFHGHIHVYRPDVAIKSKLLNTMVINSYGFVTANLERLPVKDTRFSFLRPN